MDSVQNCDAIFNNQVSHYVKLNSTKHGFTKSKSTAANFVMSRDYVNPVVRRERQADVVSLNFSNAFVTFPITEAAPDSLMVTSNGFAVPPSV
jgi:hypothetical protein